MLSCDPSLVAAAVHAVCDRGPDDMRAVRSMQLFSPSQHASLTTQVSVYHVIRKLANIYPHISDAHWLLPAGDVHTLSVCSAAASEV